MQIRWLRGASVTVGLVASLFGCSLLPPSVPDAIVPSLDGWRSAGLTCTGPEKDNVPSGLLQWRCSGSLSGTEVGADIEGDSKGVFDIQASVPPIDHPPISVADARSAFVALVAATPCVAPVRDGLSSWIDGWDEGRPGFVAGSTRAGIDASPYHGTTYYTLTISPGPRRSVDDPVP